jgi:hypothetical protein
MQRKLGGNWIKLMHWKYNKGGWEMNVNKLEYIKITTGRTSNSNEVKPYLHKE